MIHPSQLTPCPSLDDILLRYDRRGISRLRPFLPSENTLHTAAFALERAARVVVVTGFYVNGIAETDGPPGALALAAGFRKLGSSVCLIGDQYCTPLLKGLCQDCTLLEFPIMAGQESCAFAQSLLGQIQPTLLIAVERCGLTRQGLYRNMRGVDLSPYTAQLDYLFTNTKNGAHVDSVGMGDGGNEIGMGLLYEQIAALPDMIPEPTITATTRLLISTVSNWAAYGLLAGMSLLSGKKLLPTVEQQRHILHEIVARGATNGVNGRAENVVDGFSEDVNDGVLAELWEYVRRESRVEKRES